MDAVVFTASIFLLNILYMLNINYKLLVFYVLLSGQFFSSCSLSKTQEVQESGNPVVDGWYADPEGVVFDNRYWIFPTYSAPFEQQLFLDAFSSSDLVSWKKHSIFLSFLQHFVNIL